MLTSSACLAAWHLIGNFNFWLRNSPPALTYADDPTISAAVLAQLSTALLLGVVPLLVVKFVLRERLARYGLRWGNLRYAFIFSFLAAPLLIAIGYGSAQSAEFRQVYPTIPIALDSPTALAWHLFGQIFWYAAWEFHFRGFVQHGIGRSFGAPLGILVQTMASTLAHFGKPGSEIFAAILAGLLWGALAWRTRSILAGICQHWLLGASLDFFIFRWLG